MLGQTREHVIIQVQECTYDCATGGARKGDGTMKEDQQGGLSQAGTELL